MKSWPTEAESTMAPSGPLGCMPLVATAKMWEASNNLAYGHGSFLAAAAEHTREMTFFYTDLMQLSFLLGFYVLMFTTVLMGLVIGRRRWIQRAAEYAPLLPKIQLWTLGVGLGCAAVFGIGMQFTKPMEPSALKILTGTCFVVARICLMLFDVVPILRLSLVPKWQERFAGMALVGRMPLTNYISQSLICTAIFYGWGFGMWGKVGPALQLLLAFVVFFLIQVPFSRFWLNRFHYGPLEYLWRILTYGIGASGTFRIRPPVVAIAQA
jgi:uncharacterized protein